MGRPRGRPKGSKSTVKTEFRKVQRKPRQRATIRNGRIDHLIAQIAESKEQISLREKYIEVRHYEDPDIPRFKLLQEFQELCTHDGSQTPIASRDAGGMRKVLYSCDTCWKVISVG